jgi:hypothetical protein
MRQTIFRTFLVALIVAGSISSAAQERATQRGQKVILNGARLSDVKTETTITDQVIAIEGDKIRTVSPARSVKATGEGQLPSAPNASPRSATMKELKSRHLFTLTMKLPPTLELGDTPAGTRRVFTVSGGQFTGDRLRGEVLPQAGSDLLLVRQDGSAQQDVRLILRTDDGALILMTYRGVRHASQDVNARIARGERVPSSDYYLRTVPFFETSSPNYAWLNKIVSVAIGERQPDGVSYEVFEIL